jgi:hypothetical protein
MEQAISFEKQLKGWRREKKIALIEGRWADLPKLARAYTSPSSSILRQAQDDDERLPVAPDTNT